MPTIDKRNGENRQPDFARIGAWIQRQQLAPGAVLVLSARACVGGLAQDAWQKRPGTAEKHNFQKQFKNGTCIRAPTRAPRAFSRRGNEQTILISSSAHDKPKHALLLINPLQQLI